MNASPWVYFKLYVGDGGDRMEHLITESIPELIARGGHDRWFFLRYADEDGLHLRLRLRARGEAESLARELAPACQRGLATLASLPPSDHRPAVPFAGPPPPRSRFGVARALYEPELDRYGGPEGMPIAEALFERSSEIAVAALRLEGEGELSRKTLVPALMQAVAGAFLAGDDRGFWRGYAEHWLQGPPAWIDGWRARFAAKARSLREQGVAVVVPDDELVGRWREGLAAAAAAYRGLGAPPARELAFHFAHLMNNRLGCNLLEEAYFATLLELRDGAEARS